MYLQITAGCRERNLIHNLPTLFSNHQIVEGAHITTLLRFKQDEQIYYGLADQQSPNRPPASSDISHIVYSRAYSYTSWPVHHDHIHHQHICLILNLLDFESALSIMNHCGSFRDQHHFLQFLH
eukprot:TRINITY_DN3343_c1_g2_i2.p1 TRINITY_DN3343_c1_g2~~TRINITY_DN3343_c1_g2_i2.p1  ORF type:complete len:124 (-),score=6.50 TRINITY_DN3343_c1_g2_i2:327-698(-)